MKRDITFIGEFPPPFNGVSVKDKLMYERMFRDIGSQMIDLVECKRKPWIIPVVFCRLIYAMLVSRNVVIGVGAISREKVLLTIRRILKGRKGMDGVMMVIMGGRYHELVRGDRYLRRMLADVGSIWVESQQMIAGLREQGLKQVYYFPNFRTSDGEKPPRLRKPGEKLKLVFFSRICVEKGVNEIIAAYEELDEGIKNNITLDFYGEIEPDIEEEFLKFISQHENVCYHGVFDAVEHDVYTELNQYDVLLFPTRWKGEGVAGALVESKIAGITAIVSDWNINSEVVRNGEEGIIIDQPLAENLSNAINLLISDRELLMRLKSGAYESRKRYCVDTYRQIMIDHILK